jgi:pterin-4a-carbinolamine dehydratase
VTDELTLVPRNPLVFISYRRQDSSAAARWLMNTIQRHFGPSSVFMDTEAIRMGDDWGAGIDQALAHATVLVVVIGPQWLRISDEHGRRRIDREDDWVRREISYAINNRVHLIPIILGDTPIPGRAALPEDLARLPKYQVFRLRDESWEQDLALVVSRLLDHGFKRSGTRSIRYPAPHIRIRELASSEIEVALEKLSGWELSTSELPGNEPLKRVEIRKAYEFASFEDAMSFMAEASQHITKVNHHPRWENVWRTVTVSLSTWDIGHRVSKLDLELAEYLDDLKRRYLPPRKPQSGGQVAKSAE